MFFLSNFSNCFFFYSTLKHYLKELCCWAHQYIQGCDQYRSNGSLKANIVFFSVCQAIFYVIAFRSRDLTVDKKSKKIYEKFEYPYNIYPLP